MLTKGYIIQIRSDRTNWFLKDARKGNFVSLFLLDGLDSLDEALLVVIVKVDLLHSILFCIFLSNLRKEQGRRPRGSFKGDVLYHQV